MNEEPVEPITVDKFEEWMQRDLSYLEGVADTLGDSGKGIRGKLNSMRANLKRFLLEFGPPKLRKK